MKTKNNKDNNKGVMERLVNCKNNEEVIINYNDTNELIKMLREVEFIEKEKDQLFTLNKQNIEKNEFLENESRLIREDYNFVLEKNKKLTERLNRFNNEYPEDKFLNLTKNFHDKMIELNKK